MEQAGEPFNSRFLIAKIPCQLGLTSRLVLDDGSDIVPNGFELMAMCPRQHKRDILAQTSSSGELLIFHNPRLAHRRKPWLLVTLQNVSRLQLWRASSMSLGMPRHSTM